MRAKPPLISMIYQAYNFTEAIKSVNKTYKKGMPYVGDGYESIQLTGYSPHG